MSAKKTIKPAEEITEEVAEKKAKVLKQKMSFHLRNLVSTKKRKILVSIVGVLIVLAVVFAIPYTRYFVFSPFVKKDVSLKIVDSKTKKPVTNINIELGGVSSQTDKDGLVTLKAVPVGQYDLRVVKQYYKNYSTRYTVPVLTSPESPTITIDAAGRQVSVSVANKITGELLADFVVEANGTKATTGSDGLATIILPPTSETIQASLKKDGYNSLDVDLKIDDTIVNSYSATPSGSIYYLSKATGKINVMKSNLDGANATIALAATGKESDSETSLLSSRDWQYSALNATRTDNKQRLYLINHKDELSVIDEGNATFSMVGWSGHNFVYIVYRNTPNAWDNKRQALKSFNADTRKITTLDETTGIGVNYYDSSYENFSSIYIMKDEVAYLKNWYFNSYYYVNTDSNKAPTLYSINPAGGARKTIKTFAINKYVNPKLYEPQGLYLQVSSPNAYYEYENGKIKEATDVNDNQFNSFYPTFLISPSAKQTLWYEPRDGKNTVFVGDDTGKNPRTIGNLSDFTPYGWYGENDEYILLTKNGSELYISSATKTIGENGYQPLKVTDYHKTLTYPGYGYGYGGQ
ncbi:MAG: hypothetical protein ACOH18_04480 [Candidatus Saccharimonadaceae bacterium]